MAITCHLYTFDSRRKAKNTNPITRNLKLTLQDCWTHNKYHNNKNICINIKNEHVG